MSAPGLDRRMVLEGPARIADGAGGFTLSWAVRGVIWAALRPGSGREAAGEEVLVADIVKRLKVKGPVFQISALTREGCELLVQKVYEHIAKVHQATLAPVDIDPRFDTPLPS